MDIDSMNLVFPVCLLDIYIEGVFETEQVDNVNPEPLVVTTYMIMTKSIYEMLAIAIAIKWSW